MTRLKTGVCTLCSSSSTSMPSTSNCTHPKRPSVVLKSGKNISHRTNDCGIKNSTRTLSSRSRDAYSIKTIFLYSFLVTIFLATCPAYASYEDGDVPVKNTTYISQVLNRLTDRSKYDKRLRPSYGEGPVQVGITIHVSSISAVSEVDMDFTLDFYLRQNWIDPRLAFGNINTGFKKIDSLTVGVDYLERLWKPDTFFPNEKKSFFHTATTHNSFLRIDPDGRVFTSQRLTVTATCPMKLQLFPMDTQTCKLEIESYGYSTSDIDYFWGVKRTDKQDEAVAFGEFTLPQFKRAGKPHSKVFLRFLGYRVNSTKAITSTGAYLIVTISWVSFWLNREASPARVGLGVTTVLTMTTLITTTNNSMPKVSYIKGLDVFLNFCFVMVFASLVEYAVVSYLNKKLGQRREKKRKRAEAPQVAEIPMFANFPPSSPNQNYLYRPPGLPQGINSTVGGVVTGGSGPIPPDCDCRTMPLMQYAQMPADGSFRPVPLVKPRKASRLCRRISPSKIDKCSRSVFPFLFFTFQVGYWSIMTVLSSWNENQDYVLFKEEH